MRRKKKENCDRAKLVKTKRKCDVKEDEKSKLETNSNPNGKYKI